MPPRRSRSRERNPPYGFSQPEESSNKLSPASSTKEKSSSSHPQTSGASTHLQRPEDPASNMNVTCGGSMMEMSGRLSRSANTPQTLQRLPEERASKGATSPTSIPTSSPNYFDLLSEEMDHRDRPETSRRVPKRKEDGPICGTSTGKQVA